MKNNSPWGSNFFQYLFVIISLAVSHCLAGFSLEVDEVEREAVRAWGHRAAQVFRGDEVSGPKLLSSKRTERIAMRDGTRLATDVYLPLPALLGFDYPAVLIRTPYGKEDLAELGDGLATLGFICAIQDSRGCHDSAGENRSFFDDGWGIDPSGTHWDGYDTIEWLATRSYCDGKVGMFGFSALGISANYAAATTPPHLRCMVIYVAASDLYHDAAHQGGGYKKALVEDWLEDVNALPEVLNTVVANESYNALWKNASVLQRHARINVPVYHSGGWYDIFLQGTLNHFQGLQDHGSGLAKGYQKLVIGPWTHTGQATLQQGELTYPGNSLIDEAELSNARDWFEFWLKGTDNGIQNLPTVRYYLMGAVGESGAPGNIWKTSTTWPVPFTPKGLYFSPDGRLEGYPSRQPLVSSAIISDPTSPVPTVGGANLSLPAGPHDQRMIESRTDVLVFTSEPLSEPLEVVGRIRVVIHASSTAMDTDWAARLSDVYPDGRSMLVTDGLLRAKFRDGFEIPEPLVAGRIEEMTLDLWSTAMVFNKGHRIRVSLSASNYPRFEINPQNGAQLLVDPCKIIAENRFYYDRQHPSRLVLPVISPEDHPIFRQLESMSAWLIR